MNTNKKTQMQLTKTHLLFAAALIILTIMLVKFNSCKNINYNTHSTTDTVVVTVHTTDTIVKEVVKTKTKTNYIPTYVYVHNGDTTNIYKDTTISDDKLVSVYRQDSVMGKLLGSKTTIKAKTLTIRDSIKTTITITKHDSVLVPHKLALYGGLEIGGNKQTLSSISPFITLEAKNKLYTYKYNLTDNTHNIGVAIKFLGK